MYKMYKAHKTSCDRSVNSRHSRRVMAAADREDTAIEQPDIVQRFSMSEK